MEIEVLFILYLVNLLICVWLFSRTEKRINENEEYYNKKIEEVKSDITRVEQYQQDIVNSMLGDEFNLLGLHRYVRELEKTYNQIDLLIKEKGVSDMGLYNELCSKRAELRSRISKAHDEIMSIKMKGKSNE